MGCGFLFMVLTLNGKESIRTRSETLKGLIEELELKPEGVAAEVNLKVIKKKDYGNTRLKDGDKVELVNFVGGG
jgi:thiamine biosynthesis protein ThiS